MNYSCTKHSMTKVSNMMWGIGVGILLGIVLDRFTTSPDGLASVQPTTISTPSCTEADPVTKLITTPTIIPPSDRDANVVSTRKDTADYRPVTARRIHTTSLGVSYHITLFHRVAKHAGNPSMPNITFVGHVTIDRLPHVRRWCRTLEGPMSISVFVRPRIDNTADVINDFTGDLCIGRYANIHLVTELSHQDAPSRQDSAHHGIEDRSATLAKDMHVHYPSNVQRNTALDGVIGDLVFLMDIDFHLRPQWKGGLPRRGEETLRLHFEQQRDIVRGWNFLQQQGNAWVPDVALYVVPAIETISTDIDVPDSIDTLRVALKNHTACLFYGHYCKHCHHPTNLKHFLRTSSVDGDHHPYLIDYEELFEPYVIVNRTAVTKDGHALPRYNETFMGRFGDKNSFFYELYMQQRSFVVLSDYFLVHHGRGDDVKWPNVPSEEYKSRERFSLRLFAEFKELLKSKYQWGDVIARSGSSCKAEDDAAAATVVTDDPLLWTATRNIRWDVISSAGSTDGFACIATHRQLLDGGSHPERDPLILSGIEATSNSVSWACANGLDCSEVSSPGGLRYYPRSLVAQADWMFQRWTMQSVARGVPVETACHFGGAAQLVPVVTNTCGEACEGELGETPIRGCTINPDARTNRRMMEDLISDICSDPPPVNAMEDNDEVIVLGKQRRVGEVSDRIGGDCAHLFDKIDPLLAHDVRLKASVALHAHHLIFFAAGRGRTCRSRFGTIATYAR